jgi:hypothetical protein
MVYLWIKGGSSPRSLREKAKTDSAFRDRLLNYIEHVCSQCMPEEVIDKGNCDPGSRAFQTMLSPDHPARDAQPRSGPDRYRPSRTDAVGLARSIYISGTDRSGPSRSPGPIGPAQVQLAIGPTDGTDRLDRSFAA